MKNTHHLWTLTVGFCYRYFPTSQCKHWKPISQGSYDSSGEDPRRLLKLLKSSKQLKLVTIRKMIIKDNSFDVFVDINFMKFLRISDEEVN
jgi:hypothetical protein